MARPKSENPKCHRLELRVNDEELESIEYVAKELGINRSEAIILTMTERADEIYRIRTERENGNEK